MEIKFNTEVAIKLSMHEAIFLGWMEQHYRHQPIQTEELEQIFPFWKDETLLKVLVKLEERQILKTRRDKQHFCVFSINENEFQKQTGMTTSFTSTAPPAISSRTITDNNLKKHLQRFQSNNSLLNNKLTELIQDQSQQLIDYAISEGLSSEVASASLDKFLHYVSANPDRFWNTDLVAYWGFWVSNNKERVQQNASRGGKRSAIEQSNQHAASNWLRKKSQSPELHTNVRISRK